MLSFQFTQLPSQISDLRARICLRQHPDDLLAHLDTRNNRDFGDAMIRAVFDEVSGAI